jgi:hypothetical protein
MPLLSTQGQNTGYTHYLRFNYEDLQRESFRDAGTATDVRKKIAFAVKGQLLNLAIFIPNVAAVGATNLQFSCGASETGTTFINTVDMDTTNVVVNTGFALADNRNLFTSDSDIWIRVQGSLADLTAGDWTVALKIFDTPALAQ